MAPTFDDRWFYGDTLFIVDPWLWLMAATAVVLARSRTHLGGMVWLALAAATSAVVLLSEWTPPAARAFWGLGLATVIALRLAKPARHSILAARVCLALMLGYIAIMLAGGAVARREVRLWLEARGIGVEEIMAGPLPANPLSRDVIAMGPDSYRFFVFDVLARERVRPSHPSLPRRQPGHVVARALEDRSVRGMANWLRYPTWEVRPGAASHTVIIRDVRYSRFEGAGIGTAVVEVVPEMTRAIPDAPRPPARSQSGQPPDASLVSRSEAVERALASVANRARSDRSPHER